MKDRHETPSQDSSLISVDLSNSRWKQLSMIEQAILVGSLDLSKNNLTSDNTPKFPTLARLQSLDLSNNKFDSNFQLSTLFVQFPQLRVFSIVNVLYPKFGK